MSETSNNQADIRARRRFPWVAGLVLVVGLVLSVHIFYVVRMSEQLEAEQLLERKADAVQAVISERMTRFNLTGLYLRRALWWVKREDVERFNRIAESILRRYPELQAIELSLIIGAAEREAFEKLGREFVKPDYQITEPDADGRLVPAGEREKYCPIFFVRPIEGNRVAAGLDLFKAASAPVVVRTLEAGGLKASPPIRLVQETTESMGVVLYGEIGRASCRERE